MNIALGWKRGTLDKRLVTKHVKFKFLWLLDFLLSKKRKTVSVCVCMHIGGQIPRKGK